MQGRHILVVDDEPDVRETVGEYLALHGFQVTTAESAADARKRLVEKPVDIVLLDVNMPGEDGLTFARFLREHQTLGIVMLTAAGEVIDRIVGLEIGADDYIPKPVDLRELLARIKAVLRRLAAGAAAPVSGKEAAKPRLRGVAVGEHWLDLDAHRLLDKEGREVPLTAMEFDLLRVFAERPNRPLTRDQLLDYSHNRSWEPFDRSIDIRIARLRRKLEDDPKKPQILKTVRGVGYMLSTGRRGE